MADEPIFYWDACIFLEHLREENVAATKRAAIRRLLSENKEHKNRIITSTITHVEVLPKKVTIKDSQKEVEYWSYYDGRWFIDLEITRPIVNLARDLKDYYFVDGDRTKGIGHKMLSTGDALHLATAIVYNVEEFHTRDGRRSGGNIPLIGLPEASANGKIAGQWPLKIVSPEDPQPGLFDQ